MQDCSVDEAPQFVYVWWRSAVLAAGRSLLFFHYVYTWDFLHKDVLGDEGDDPHALELIYPKTPSFSFPVFEQAVLLVTGQHTRMEALMPLGTFREWLYIASYFDSEILYTFALVNFEFHGLDADVSEAEPFICTMVRDFSEDLAALAFERLAHPDLIFEFAKHVCKRYTTSLGPFCDKLRRYFASCAGMTWVEACLILGRDHDGWGVLKRRLRDRMRTYGRLVGQLLSARGVLYRV